MAYFSSKAVFFHLLMLLSVPAFAQDFFDDFNGKTLDEKKWEKADSKWGTTARGNNGGVVPQNAFVKNGNLVIRAHGNLYNGPVKGHDQNTKVGGAVFTKTKFGSGSYEIRAKICPQLGALTAFWTYYYENDSCNHEIDFEFPGRNQKPNKPENSDLTWGLLTNWQGVNDSMHRNVDMYFGNQTDGQYHLYRFDWYSGSNGETARVEWYYDGKLLHTAYEMVPFKPAKMWLGVWFPTWIGQADFDTDYMYVDWIKIKAFKESNESAGTK